MKSIFTPHAGEFLVGQKIEKTFGLSVWLPSKDVGVDLLVSDVSNRHTCSLQVKLSRDYSDAYKMPTLTGDSVMASGWFQFQKMKIEVSTADYWVLIVVSPKRVGEKLTVHHVVIRPSELLSRLDSTHGELETYKLYLAITQSGKVLDWRGLKHQSPLAWEDFKNSSRSYTEHLEDWSCVERLLLK
jgi:hypothetical protein